MHHLLREKNILDECKSINSLLVIFFRILFSCLSLLVISSKRKYADGVSYLLIRCELIRIPVLRSVMLVGINPAYRKLKYFEVHNTRLCITCDGKWWLLIPCMHTIICINWFDLICDIAFTSIQFFCWSNIFWVYSWNFYSHQDSF